MNNKLMLSNYIQQNSKHHFNEPFFHHAHPPSSTMKPPFHRTCPIICVSCVTGSNLPLLCAFFQQLASTQQHYVKDSPEFQVGGGLDRGGCKGEMWFG